MKILMIQGGFGAGGAEKIMCELAHHRAQGSLSILAGQTRLRGDRRAQFVLIHGTKNPP